MKTTQSIALTATLVLALAGFNATQVEAMVPQSQLSLTSNRVLYNQAAWVQLPGMSVTFGAMEAGETRLLTARLLATNYTRGTPVQQAIAVRCYDSNGALSGLIGQAAENHTGYSTSAGGNYPVTGQLAIVENWLFSAPGAGSYSCSAWASAASTALAPGVNALTALASGTYLKYSASPEPAAGQWRSNQCSSNGVTGCTYVGPGGAASAYALYGSGAPGLTWFAEPSAVALEGVTDIAVTTCNASTNSCQVHGSTSFTSSTIDVQLQLIRIDSNGSTCQTFTNPSSGYTRFTVRDASHHQKLHLHLARAAINTATCGGSRRFIIRALLVHVAGLPVKLDGEQGVTNLSSGFVMNLRS